MAINARAATSDKTLRSFSLAPSPLTRKYQARQLHSKQRLLGLSLAINVAAVAVVLRVHFCYARVYRCIRMTCTCACRS